jgi:DNA glycosylase AlkZ-like
MTSRDIAHYRLINQLIASARSREPLEVVAKLGAMQAQDYLGALWAVGLRLADAAEAAVERAIAERQIIRTWPMRGALHFVAPADVRWMLELLAPRIIAGSARRCLELELDDTVFVRSRKIFVRALQGGRQLTRSALMDLLERAKISTANQRGYHILWRLALEKVLCCAARSGKQPTFALLDEWVPETPSLDRDAALAELARRYFTSHGPATLQDFAWWTGLKVADAKAGLESVRSELSSETMDGAVYWIHGDLAVPPEAPRVAYLLPGFDEYFLGYTDRSAVLEPRHPAFSAKNGMFPSTIVIDGRVVGTWKREITKEEVIVTACPFTSLKKAEKNAFAVAAEHYGRFLSLPVVVRAA